MLKKVISYVDYNDVEREETFYFNLSKSEVAEMELSMDGGLKSHIERIVETKDQVELLMLFKTMILKSYGEKSPDGKRFIKSEELSIAFSQTEAYSNLFMELASSTQATIDFVNGIVPDFEGKEELMKGE